MESSDDEERTPLLPRSCENVKQSCRCNVEDSPSEGSIKYSIPGGCDEGSRIKDSIPGGSDEGSFNYSMPGGSDEGSIKYSTPGDSDEGSFNYSMRGGSDEGSSKYSIPGGCDEGSIKCSIPCVFDEGARCEEGGYPSGTNIDLPRGRSHSPVACKADKVNHLPDADDLPSVVLSTHSPSRDPGSPGDIIGSCDAVVIAESIETVDDASSSPSESSTSSSSSSSLSELSRQEKIILASLFLVDLSSALCMSVMAPFFPQEAALKGISDTTSGFIFGVFALVQFLSSPFYGKMMPHLGARFMFLSGQFFAGGTLILFGMLDYMDVRKGDVTLYVTSCIVLRVFMALGATASNTASFAITATTFNHNLATVFGLLETACGLGMMLGPGIGGPLYQVGGFSLPFVTLGGAMILLVPINAMILPRPKGESRRCGGRVVTGSIMAVLRVPSILITCVAVVMSAIIWAMLDPTLQPHLATFNLSPTMLSLIFLLMSACYAVFSPVWGWVADRMTNSLPMLVMGFLSCAVGLSLLGPTPLFGLGPQYNELWLNIVALVILGTANSLATVPTFDKILHSANVAGIDEHFGSFAVVAGIWGSCYALGEFLGPTLGGWLLDAVDFPWMTTYCALGSIVMAVVLLCLWLYEIRCKGFCCCSTKYFIKDRKITLVPANITATSKTVPYNSLLRVTMVTERTPLLGGGMDDAVAVHDCHDYQPSLEDPPPSPQQRLRRKSLPGYGSCACCDDDIVC